MLIMDPEEIRKYVSMFAPFRFKDGAYELTLKEVMWLSDAPHLIDYKSDGKKLTYSEVQHFDSEGSYQMPPTEHVMVRCREALDLPNHVYAVGYALKSMSRAGIGMVGNPLFHLGYSGVPELTLYNYNVGSYYRMYDEQPVIQLQFFKTHNRPQF